MAGSPIFEYFAKLSLDSSDVDKKVEDAKEKTSKFASFLSGAGKVGAAAFAAIGTATVAMGKQAVDAYANYEQLAGGIEKLFGSENAGIVAEYAEKAFLTSGKSINEYYNSVSQITASLKRSVGDDMNEVARVADIAMQAISDNVNTFGSDAEFVENAFMGLSRNNYTMIDNLKLGYAGSAQGMLELINDSGILGKTLTDTSELATVGFDKMILAIQKIQEEQGIAGTTAKEALHTIEGSANATKSAWQNVLTAIGRGEGLNEALSGLTTALFGDETEDSGFLAQIIPRIQETMESIGTFITEAAPLLAEKIPEIATAILPSIFNTVSNIVGNLGTFIFQSLPTILSTLSSVAMEMVTSTAGFILDNLPTIIQSGVEMLNGLASGISSSIPEIVKVVTDVIAGFLGEILYELPDIVAAGINIVLGLIEGIINSIPYVLDAVGELIDKAWNAITDFDWVSVGRNIIEGIASGISALGHIIGDTLSRIAESAWNGVKRFFGISSPSKLMRDTIGKFIPLGMAEGIEDESDSVYDAMDDLNDGAISKMDTVFDDIDKKTIGEADKNVNYGGLTFNIYGAEGQNVQEIAEAVKEIIINQEKRSKLVYA